MRYPFRQKVGGARFIHPLDPAPKTVLLANGFQGTRTIRVFPDGWNEEAARQGPCAVAAPLEDLLRLARSGVKLQHAVIVLTRGAHSDLSEDDRDRLWAAFGVPVFEQCLGPYNELLAAECEAHDGLHIVGGERRLAGETGLCGCGSSVPRMLPQYQPNCPAFAPDLMPALMTA